MGPTNVALVKLYLADQKLREAQGRLDATTRNVRIQERRTKDLSDKITAASNDLKEKQAHAGNLDLDLKTRDTHIEKLRTQQQQAKNNKEYQAFLIEINTGKVDRNKVEEETLVLMEENEKAAAAIKELQTQLDGEKAKLTTMQAEIVDKTASIRKEIADLTPAREAAASVVPAKARLAFDRLADRFEGEALSPIVKPDRRVEEYTCTSCMMGLVRDVYNRLHTRDELVFCPSCQRILYIPEDLTPEVAVHKPKERKERAQKAPPAVPGRQSNAIDVLRSINQEPDEPEMAVEEDKTSPEQPAAETQQPQEQPPAASPEQPN